MEAKTESKKEPYTSITYADLSWLENPRIFAVNRLPAHSDHAFYPSVQAYEKAALQSNSLCGMTASGEHTSELMQSLNGTWKFHWSPNPSLRPEKFTEPDYDLSSFDTIEVPCHMELAGYGQIQYTNTAYPWDGHSFLRPPFIDWTDNPVGSYVREFIVDKNLSEKRICISFQGAEQAIYVWLNGHFVGYGEDSFTPSDFDITDFIKLGENRLCVEVYKRSSAAWIEDQDFFRFSGLFREVFLYAKPEGHIEDLKIQADYYAKPLCETSASEGEFSVSATVSGGKWRKVVWELTSRDGSRISEGQLEAADEPEPSSSAVRQLTSGRIKLQKVRPWDVGNPYLYRLLLRVLDEQDAVLEVVPYDIGFRRFEIADNVMLLNGKRLLVNGVNRHEWNPKTGRAVTEKDMREDIRIMKENGINAVRTCHYPNQSLWYKLCDEAGICVLDETNLESHGSCMKLGITETSWNIPGSDSSWEDCCLARAKSMYERDKNHPSILWWSAGNESHVGTVIQKMCEYFHSVDSTRPVHYEPVFYDRSFDFITDVESRMYPTPEAVREYLENHPKKPMLLCEYMHDMGNSLGGLESYMKLREEFETFAGGFLWDFIDQALYMNTDKSIVDASTEDALHLGYGGDFGERPTDYAFCANGLLFADRREKPAMQEVRYWYLSKQKRTEHDLENMHAEELCRARVTEELLAFYGSDTTPTDAPFLKMIHTDYNLGIRGEDFHYIFSFDKGGPVSLVIQGKEQLYRAPKPTFWRAPTENDMGCGQPTRSAQWAGADRYSQAKECIVEEFGDNFTETLVPTNFTERKPARADIREVEIRYAYETATTPSTAVTVAYRVNARGAIRITLRYKGNPLLPELPVFGLRMQTTTPLSSYTWNGLSGETYPDRYKGAKFGAYTEELNIPAYLVPQECGNHTHTYRMEADHMIFLMCEMPFNFSVLPYTQQELETALHIEELPESCRSTISILGAIRGVGGIDSWGSDVETAYQISGGKDLEFSFYMLPKLQA